MVISVPCHLGSPDGSLPLPLYLLLHHGVSLIVKDPPFCGLKMKTLVTGEVWSATSPENVVGFPEPHVLTLTHPSCRCDSRNDWACLLCPLPLSQRNELLHPPPDFVHFIDPLGMDSSSRLTLLCLVAAGVTVFNHSGLNKWCSVFDVFKTSSSPVNNQAYDEHTSWIIPGWYGAHT